LHQKMVRQEGLVTMWELTDILFQRLRGSPLGYSFPASGSPVIDDSIGLVKGSRQGEAALKARDYESAMAHFGRALQLYPDDGDHHAHYGWSLYLCHPSDPSMVGEALEHVRRGIKLASNREKPYLFMGRLYKAIGRADVAEKMFTRAVHIAPECLEALRELRLIHMRREKSKGLIGRLLRR